MTLNPIKQNYDRSEAEIRSFLQDRAVIWLQKKAGFIIEQTQEPIPVSEMTCMSEYHYCSDRLIEKIFVSKNTEAYYKEFTVILLEGYKFVHIFMFNNRQTVLHSDIIAECLRKRYNLLPLWYDQILDDSRE